MALYNNTDPNAAISAVEFSPVPAGNLTFFYLRDEQDIARAKEWLASPAIGQQLLAQTVVGGKPVLVTQGDKSQKDMLSILGTQSGHFQLHHPERKINLWKVRGLMGTIGQLGQVASSLMPADGKIDKATLTFAAANLVANGINVVFGAEKKNDTFHEYALKNDLNQKLSPHLVAQAAPLSPDDNRLELRKEPEKPATLGSKIYGFLQRNSVSFGEIGLRFFGSFVLAFPMQRWGMGLAQLRKGNFAEAYLAARNTNILTHAGGLTYLTGKSIALTSKIYDPYDPKPHTAIDSLRENVTFRLSSLIEAGAGSMLAYDRLFRDRKDPKTAATLDKIKLPEWSLLGDLAGRRYTKDYFGGVGGMLFASAYITRFFAPLGAKHLNLAEIKAHATDTLAKVPPEKMPQLLADCAATIKEHAGPHTIEFGQIYTQMTTDLYRYHHVAQANLAPLGAARENDPFPELHRRTRHPAMPGTHVEGHGRHIEPMLATHTARAAG